MRTAHTRLTEYSENSPISFVLLDTAELPLAAWGHESNAMNIKQIVRRKGDTVFDLRPDSSVREFATLVARQGIGAAPVTDGNGGLVGVVSERDVTRTLATRGSATAELPVAELMTTSVVSCTPENSVSDIVNLMHQNNIRHLPVVEDEVLVGFLSIRDVVFSRLNEMELDNMALREMLENYDTIG